MTKIYKVCIVGSGPAGYTAAIYTARANLNPLMFVGTTFGGQLMTTSDVENFPGYRDGICGPKLMEDLHAQAERFGMSYKVENVTNIETSSRPYKVTTCTGDTYETWSVIIATGAQSIWLNAKNEEKAKGKGISTCATCDGAFFKDEQIIVVGGGDSAMEEANFLTRYASKVTLIHRRDDFRASKIMLDRARSNPKIHFITPHTVKEWLVNDNGTLNGAVIESVKDPEQTTTIKCTGAFIAIGHKPCTVFLNGIVELDNNGYIVLKNHTETSVPGVFACGDVADTRYKQAITAAGEGCKAAMDCEKWLEELGI